MSTDLDLLALPTRPRPSRPQADRPGARQIHDSSKINLNNMVCHHHTSFDRSTDRGSLHKSTSGSQWCVIIETCKKNRCFDPMGGRSMPDTIKRAIEVTLDRTLIPVDLIRRCSDTWTETAMFAFRRWYFVRIKMS